MNEAKIIADEIEISEHGFCLKLVFEVVGMEGRETLAALVGAQHAGDFKFFLHVGFALGRLFERKVQKKN